MAKRKSSSSGNGGSRFFAVLVAIIFIGTAVACGFGWRKVVKLNEELKQLTAAEGEGNEDQEPADDEGNGADKDDEEGQQPGQQPGNDREDDGNNDQTPGGDDDDPDNGPEEPVKSGLQIAPEWVGNGITLLSSEIAVEDFGSYDVSPEAESAYEVTAIIQFFNGASSYSDEDIVWKLTCMAVTDTGKWEDTNDIEDYLTLSDDSGGTVILSCLQAFDVIFNLTAELPDVLTDANSLCYASLYLSYSFPEEEPEGELGMIVPSEAEGQGIKITSAKISVEDYGSYGISSEAESAYLLTADYTNTGFTPSEIIWTFERLDRSLLEDYKDCVTLANVDGSSEGEVKGETVILICYKAFEVPLVINVEVKNPAISRTADMYISYGEIKED